jgi:Glu-tRNA(Gln) amidotransferase subunit E-like FAD-binding protein
MLLHYIYADDVYYMIKIVLDVSNTSDAECSDTVMLTIISNQPRLYLEDFCKYLL